MHKKSDAPPKPAAPIAKQLRMVWLIWLIWAGVLYPLVLGFSADIAVWSGIMIKIIVLLPALLATPAILKANSPYALMWISMLALVYLGAQALWLLVRVYEQAVPIVSFMLTAEVLLLLIINVLLFMLLKRLPAMHKQLKALSQDNE